MITEKLPSFVWHSYSCLIGIDGTKWEVRCRCWRLSHNIEESRFPVENGHNISYIVWLQTNACLKQELPESKSQKYNACKLLQSFKFYIRNAIHIISLSILYDSLTTFKLATKKNRLTNSRLLGLVSLDYICNLEA